MQNIKLEIEKIYTAIKAVGFSGRIGVTEKDWQKAALDAFHDSKKRFSSNKKETP